ncbi:MAG: prepilin-type N-terminal cleavage/methylation domain-containing protein [Clostridia bacterium]|nr:prepilin-type N-terminal cleavage/methylation domain-containing protein [Clostridia bacterium]
MKTNNKGFSLVELIVVIAIMAILAAVAIPTFSGFITKANVSSDESFINDVTYAAKIAHTVEGTVSDVTVTATKGDVATQITYKVTDSEDNVVTYTITSATAVTADPTTASTEAAEDVAASIDWTYKFKTADTRTVTED